MDFKLRPEEEHLFDKYAGLAMQGLLAHNGYQERFNVGDCFLIAEVMIEERRNRKGMKPLTQYPHHVEL